MYKKIIDGKAVYSECKVINIGGGVCISNPTEEMLAENGWVKCDPVIVGREADMEQEYQEMLEASREKMLSLMEAYFAENGTGELKRLAEERMALRDSLGKVIKAPEGDYTSPILYEPDMSVEEGKFYTDGDDIWEAKKSGIPSGFDDTEYFDIIL